MIEYFRRILRIEPGEGKKILLFSALGALLTGGLAIGMSGVDAVFLSEAGATALPIIYVLTPLVMLIYIPVFSYLLARVGVDRLFDITIGILVAGGLVLFNIFSGQREGGHMSLVVLCGVKLYANMWLFALYTLYWNFADGYFDIRDAKRLFALFSGGSAFGAMVGGGLVAILIEFIPVQNLFLVWSCIALLTAPMLIYLRRACTKVEEDDTLDESKVRFVDQMKGMFDALRKSRFVLMLALVIFLTLSITLVCEYQYMTVFSQNAKAEAAEFVAKQVPAVADAAKAKAVDDLSAQKLASLFGKLNVWVNAFILLVNVFLFNRLINFIGVRNAALIQPVIYTGVFTWFLLDNGPMAAVAGFFAYQGVMIAIEQNNQNFLFNAMPAGVRKQIRTFIEGIAEPLAVALAGMFLLLYGKDTGAGSVDAILKKLLGDDGMASFKDAIGVGQLGDAGISLIGLCGAVLVFLLVLVLRSDYMRAMVVNLRRSWLDFSKAQSGMLSRLVWPEVVKLIDATRSPDSRQAVAALRLLVINDAQSAMNAWLDFWRRASDADKKEAQLILVEILRGGDSSATFRIVKWMQKERVDLVPELVEEMGRRGLLPLDSIESWLASRAEPEKRSAAAVAFWSSWRFDRSAHSLDIVMNMLSGDEHERRQAIRALGLAGEERFAHFVASYLEDPSENVRSEALLAILRLASRDSARLIPAVLRVIATATHEQRSVCMRIMEKIGDSSSIIPLLAAARTFTPAERRAAEQLIVGIGLQGVPAVVTVLQQGTFPYRGRSIAARALGRLSFAQYESLAPATMEAELRRAYEFVASQEGLARSGAKGPGVALLSRFYRDAQATIVDFVLELLTIGGRLPSFELLSASLRSSNPKERADAVETIEQGCDRATFALLLPLIDPRQAGARAGMVEKLGYTCNVPVREIIARSIASPIPLECASALLAMKETGDERFDESLRKVLLENPDVFVRESALALLGTGPDRRLGAVEKVSLLAGTGFLDVFNVMEVVYAISNAEEKAFSRETAIFAAGDRADCAFVVVDGEAEVVRGGSRTTVGPGGLIGRSGVVGGGNREESAVSRGCRVLELAARHLENAALVSPRAATGLLAMTMEGDVIDGQ